VSTQQDRQISSRIRAGGATRVGYDAFATTNGTAVVLRAYRGEPEAIDFIPSRIPAVAGLLAVERSEVESLAFVQVVCRWNGEPFMIVGVGGEFADVFYIGERGEWACQQPGLIRSGKLETHGRLRLSDLPDIHEIVNPM
jgi:hypothetical protein